LKKPYGILLSILLLLSNCKTLQKTTGGKTEHIDKIALLQKLDSNRFDAQTFDSRIHITYSDTKQNMKGNGRIKILKDSIIWGSLNFMGIPMIKFMITPQQIQYYNKLNQTYYNGDFAVVSRRLGTKVGFENLQNLLLGDVLYPIQIDAYSLKRKTAYYKLKSKQNRLLKDIFITPFYKVSKESIQSSYQPPASIRYIDYQNIDNKNIPQKLIVNTGKGIHLEIQYKSPSLDKNLRFPFKIPSGYSRVW